MSRTLYVTDLDGTLLNSSASMSELTRSTVSRAAGSGVMFTYATARSFASAGPIMAGLGLTLPVVTYNGAFMVDPASGETLVRNTMERRAAAALLAAVELARVPALVYSIIDGAERVSWVRGHENRHVREYLDARRGDRRLRPVDAAPALGDGEVFYVTVIGDDAEIGPISAASGAIPSLKQIVSRDIYGARAVWLEIYDSKASKAAAARYLKRALGADKLICFGDNINDIPMLIAADEGYAVANAHADVIRAAGRVVMSNDNDGVARKLAELEAL